ncbi:MAG: hypothetical protein KC800_17595 [Candidatus Eremiobacteraeota bacterium]|nr:hypothetical protein [Candidatus Eremiobacteraeota bacterium]
MAKKKEILILALVIAVVATFCAYRFQKPTISISGVSLKDTRASSCSHLEFDDYRHFSSDEWTEHFYRMDSANIDIVYDESGSIHRLEGGIPEVDGEDASHWTADQFAQSLGPAALGGSSRTVGETGRSHLAYPEHRLLIYFEPTGNRFVLFKSGKDSSN